MLVRLFLGVGVFALGYYLGRAVGRSEPVRAELQRARESRQAGPEQAPTRPASEHPTAGVDPIGPPPAG